MLKLKSHKTCGECPSCQGGPNGILYCSLKASDPKNSQMDISTCKVCSESKPEDCPWDKVGKFVDSLGTEDQMGLKCISKMFSGNGPSLFEEEEIQPTIGKWIETAKMLPKERDWYLGVFKEPDTGWINPVPFICDYLLGAHTAYTTNEGWIIKDCTDDENAPDYYKNLQCVAWMPLPESYSRDNWGEDIHHA